MHTHPIHFPHPRWHQAVWLRLMVSCWPLSWSPSLTLFMLVSLMGCAGNAHHSHPSGWRLKTLALTAVAVNRGWRSLHPASNSSSWHQFSLIYIEVSPADVLSPSSTRTHYAERCLRRDLIRHEMIGQTMVTRCQSQPDKCTDQSCFMHDWPLLYPHAST